MELLVQLFTFWIYFVFQFLYLGAQIIDDTSLRLNPRLTLLFFTSHRNQGGIRWSIGFLLLNERANKAPFLIAIQRGGSAPRGDALVAAVPIIRPTPIGIRLWQPCFQI